MAIYDASDTILMRFQYAGSRLPVAMTSGGATYYLAYDQVGSLRMVTDASGNVIESLDYDSFGNIIPDTNPSFDMPFGFAGGLYDSDTGLVRFGFREYSPEIGRWTAKDPILFLGRSTDLYGYCLNDPINFIDTDGRLINFAAAGIGALAGGLINGVYAYSKGESFWKGAAVGALAGGLAGLTLNPFIVGAMIGAATTTGNIIACIDKPDDKGKAILTGAAVGALTGGIGGYIGEAAIPAAPVIGQAVGETAAAITGNDILGYVDFWQGF